MVVGHTAACMVVHMVAHMVGRMAEDLVDLVLGYAESKAG